MKRGWSYLSRVSLGTWTPWGLSPICPSQKDHLGFWKHEIIQFLISLKRDQRLESQPPGTKGVNYIQTSTFPFTNTHEGWEAPESTCYSIPEGQMEKGQCTAYRRSPGSTLDIRTRQSGSTIALLSRGWARDRKTRSWNGSSKSWAPKICPCMNGRSGTGNYSGEGGPDPSQTPANIVPLLLRSVVAWGQVQTCQTLYGRCFDAGSNSGTGAEHQQGKHRSRVTLQDCMWGSPGPTVTVHKQQGRCLFSREWDQSLPETCQEAFPHKYARNINSQYSFPHSPVDKFVKQFYPTPISK